MGVVKRIATARIWNPNLWGDDPETKAMRKLDRAWWKQVSPADPDLPDDNQEEHGDEPG